MVVGAGPIGLAAAAHAAGRGLRPLVLEAGHSAGAAVAQWQHVQLFSTWSRLIDPAAARLLTASGWQPPAPEVHPTGAEWLHLYLYPLAAALGDRVRFGARVVGVARRGWDRVADGNRDAEPLTVHVSTAAGEERITAKALIDASGTWSSFNPLGADGLPAAGETAAADRIAYRLPDLADAGVRARFADRRVAVVGNGHSALTALAALGDLAERHSLTQVAWLLRRDAIGDVFGGDDADQLLARDALERRAKAAVHGEHVQTVTGFRVAAVSRAPGGRLVLESVGGRLLDPVDEVLALTGFRPDMSWLSELRLDLDPVLHAPRALAPLVDPRVHTCRSVQPHGAAELTHPEPNVFVVGMKSYGRAPAFLAKTGYEQVSSVIALIAGTPGASTPRTCSLAESSQANMVNTDLL